MIGVMSGGTTWLRNVSGDLLFLPSMNNGSNWRSRAVRMVRHGIALRWAWILEVNVIGSLYSSELLRSLQDALGVRVWWRMVYRKALVNECSIQWANFQRHPKGT